MRRPPTSLLLAWLALAASCLCKCPGAAAATDDPAYELKRDGRTITGRLLAFSGQKGYLLGVDGRLWPFDAHEAGSVRGTGSPFRAAPPSLLRGMLLAELGAGYEVTGAGRFMIAHSAGERDVWAARFDEFYRSFVHYFSVRGLKLEQPPCLLAGVVCRNRNEFARMTRGEGLGAPAGIVGWYNRESNRLMVYDMQGRGGGGPWQTGGAYLIHEATHQLAFNMGIHNRCAPPPTWVAEGLATMFEAPGVYDSRSHAQFRDRLNVDRLRYFREAVRPQFTVKSLKAMVASDALFQADPMAAYAQAWALTFYLAESSPRKYAAYLAKTAAQDPFSTATPKERLADFAAAFGSDWPMLHAQFLRFIDQ